MAGRGVRIGAAVGEAGQHGRTAHYAVADQGSGVLAILSALQPVGNRLIVAVFHLVDIILRFNALQYRAGLVELLGYQLIIVGQRKHGT